MQEQDETTQLSINSQQVIERVAEAVQKLLGRPVNPQEPLTEAGLDSLGSVELRSSLGATFDLELPATLAFDYPSIDALAKFIASQLTETSLVTGEKILAQPHPTTAAGMTN